MKSLKIKSYCKINLALLIKNKRKDNYHEINSIMQTISLFDTIKLKKNNKLSCKINIKNIPTDEKNLAIKAANTFFDYVETSKKVKIIIKKRVPTQAGLGGGSSNAAFVLLGLNKLFKANLKKQTLLKLAEKIGADVPFFIYGGTAFVEGLGEIVKKIKPLKDFYIVLVKPNFGMNTKKTYEKYDELKIKEKKSIEKIILSISQEEKIEEITKNLFNDFEKVIKSKIIFEIKNKMKNYGALCCNLTGSGSCVFAIFKDKTKAKKAKKLFKKEKFKTFLCKPIEKIF